MDNFDWNEYLKSFEEIIGERNKSGELIEEDYFFKETTADKDRTGWIILEEYINTSINSINLVSIPEAWCGVEFKINVISIGATNLILGSPELEEYPIDREEIVKIVKIILDKKVIKKIGPDKLDDLYYWKIDDTQSIKFKNDVGTTINSINWDSSTNTFTTSSSPSITIFDMETKGL